MNNCMLVFVKLVLLLLPKQPICGDNLKNSRNACYILLRSLKLFLRLIGTIKIYICINRKYFSFSFKIFSILPFVLACTQTSISRSINKGRAKSPKLKFWSQSMQKNVPWFAQHCVLCVFLAMLASMYYKTGCVRWSKQATRFSSHPLS